jgi:RNA polymerase sigma-70 factor (ECF subfamily)
MAQMPGPRPDATVLKAQLADAGAASDEALVARVLGGEHALFELLLRRHNQRLFRVARAILRQDADAEDAVQQAWISAYQRLDQFAGAARFSTWLTRIAIHASLARLRQTHRRGEVGLERSPNDEQQEEQMSRLPSPSPDPEQQASRRELVALVERAIDELPDIYRVVIMLRQVQQLSTAETAACLEVSEEVVKVRLHRGTALLRDALSARVDEVATDSFAFLGARCDRIVAGVLAAIAALPPRASS